MSSLKTFLKSINGGEVLLPELRSYLVNRQKLEKLGKETRKTITVRDAKMTIACFTERKDEFNHGEEIEGEYFHPSALGRCMRQQFYDIKDAPQDTPKGGTDLGEELLRMHMTFETGTYMHVIIQNLCEAAGLLVKREVAIKDEKRKILGHLDAHLKIKGVGYALEFKSMGSAGFIRLTAPKPEHKAQVHAYMRSKGLKWAIILYCNKDNGQFKEFVIPYDHAFYLENVFHRIREFFSKLRRFKLPKREGDNPRSFPCMYCPYTRVCFESGYSERWMKGISKERRAKMF